MNIFMLLHISEMPEPEQLIRVICIWHRSTPVMILTCYISFLVLRAHAFILMRSLVDRLICRLDIWNKGTHIPAWTEGAAAYMIEWRELSFKCYLLPPRSPSPFVLDTGTWGRPILAWYIISKKQVNKTSFLQWSFNQVWMYTIVTYIMNLWFNNCSSNVATFLWSDMKTFLGK